MSKTMPEMRFDGFSGDWEEKILGDISKVYDGTHQTPQYTNSGVSFISVENINDIYNSSKYISEEDFQKEFKINAKKGDIFMTRITAGVIGSTAIVKNDISLAYYVSLALLKPNFDLIETLFLNANMQSIYFKKELNRRIIHTAFPKKINLGDISKCKISHTDLEEQRKIGVFFKQLDDTIALQQQLVEQQQQYKTAMLQKMFPQKGERVPKVRFDGFSGDWEEKKLSDLAQRFNNLRVPITASERVSGTTPYYGANGIQDYVDGFTHEGEFILVAEDGANDLRNYPVKYVSGKIWVNNHAHVLSAIGNIADKTFLVQAFQNINIEPYLVGGSRAKLNSDVLMKLEFLTPIIDEQQKIGAFFKQLDDTIALHEKKLEDYQQLKKALLQRMFV
ncbi:type I restriction enzyme S subunit [Bacillus sp. LEw-kw-24]|uniref:restriction endonuclease subunit S n=1 Tax=unclassified Bacillus (in: firmicutes) TaxID=185979 RepID=UPI00240675AC|nr:MULTISPECIES: restriction endonuclease subunit S [unclassified Bacillus (in: firmicutes)]MDF9887873.1 type I restriction enzyme S subunit [Bacillus sp. LEw-kw-24]MDH6558370.1 type I restriction enzyme S subunit [Bacillus sp. LEw-kw-2]